MSGHYSPEVGRAFEDGFIILLERLGYRIWRKRDTRTGLDVVATFNDVPIYPNQHQSCILQKPIFAPNGVIAFSAKKGNFTERDIRELLEKIERGDTVIINKIPKPINRGIIVTNYTKTESKLRELLEREIFCWDIIRLLFYANKARICFNLSQSSSVKEYLIEEEINGSYLLSPRTLENGIMQIDIIILIDEHRKKYTISADHLTLILRYIYEKSLVPILESIPLDIQARFEIHILNLADRELLDKAYAQFAGSREEHPRVTYLRDFKIFSYVSSPWMPFLNLFSTELV